MKTFSLSVLAALVFLPGSAPADIDFTLQRQTTNADAVSANQPYVTDGPIKIFLQFPNTWHAHDNGQGLELIPTVANASVRLENYHGPELTIDDAGARQLLQQVVAGLSKDAKNVTAYPVECNPFPILGWKDLQVIVRYELFGQTYRRSTMYVQMSPGRTVNFSLIALDTDFDKLYKPARAVLASFFEVDSGASPDLIGKSASNAPQ